MSVIQPPYFGIISAAAPFSPISIAGLKLWNKADALVLSNNDPVSSWTDSSGTGNAMIQMSGGSQPLFKTNIQNGLPIVRFDGTDDSLANASPTGLTTGTAGLTVFMVVRQAALTGNKAFIGKWTYSSQGSWSIQTFGVGADAPQVFVADGLTDPGNNEVIGTDAGLNTTNFAIVTMKYDGSQSAANRIAFYKNGTTVTLQVTGTIPATLVTCSAPLSIGVWPGLGRNFNGDFGEILIYDNALNNTNRGLVETYLSTKWAIV